MEKNKNVVYEYGESLYYNNNLKENKMRNSVSMIPRLSKDSRFNSD